MGNQDHLVVEIPLSEKIKAIPGIIGINLEEQPQYDVLRSDGAFEIRCYNSQRLASIELETLTEENKKSAFMDLTNYIFGYNETKEKMSMTLPVFLDNKVMSFILPHNSSKKAPLPTDGRIQLKENSMRVVASITYYGNNTPEKIEANKELLRNWLLHHPWYFSVSNVMLAEYSGVFTLPFLRKNELHVEVKNIH